MKTLPKPKLLLICAGVIFGASAIGSYLQMSSRAVSSKKRQDLASQLRDKSTVQRELTTSNEDVAKFEGTVKHLTVVDAVDYAGLLTSTLEQVGFSAGVKVNGVQEKQSPFPKPVVEKGEDGKRERPKPYTEKWAEVKCSGGYRQIRDFIAALTKMPLIVQIESVDIAPRTNTQNQKNTGSLDATIQLRGFLFAEAKKTATSEAVNG
ncbi:MAG: type 4a pilus biogenesis protein PilO [Armatimonadetes bacterium]|nr:type 4a pilus biogenesis protein PilO [Armatimonadota bacterium]